MANDPHLGLTAPAIWYLARLELSSGGVIGGTIPGIPAILTGRSAQLGWGLTSAYVDDQDVFIEEINPNNPDQYLGPNGYQDFVTRKTIIKVAEQEPITLTLRWTDNGPVLPASNFDLGTVTPKGHVAAVSWTVLSPADTSMNAAIDLMFAQDVREAIRNSEAFLAPAQNLTLVDSDTIAMKVIGGPATSVCPSSKSGSLSEPWVQGREPLARPPAIFQQSRICCSRWRHPRKYQQQNRGSRLSIARVFRVGRQPTRAALAAFDAGPRGSHTR